MICPDCNATVPTGTYACECGWYSKTEPPELTPHREPPHERCTPSPEVFDAIKAASKPRSRGSYWTPDKLVNEAQVAFIVRQADHFGLGSVAGRCLFQCIEAGVITKDRRLQK